jgi:hypothetical protein
MYKLEIIAKRGFLVGTVRTPIGAIHNHPFLGQTFGGFSIFTWSLGSGLATASEEQAGQ